MLGEEEEVSERERGWSPAAKRYLNLMRDPIFVYPHLMAAASAVHQTQHESDHDPEPRQASQWPAPSRGPFESHMTSRKLPHCIGCADRWPTPGIRDSPSVGPGGELALARTGSLDRAVRIRQRRPSVRGAAAVSAATTPGPGAYGSPSRLRGCPSSPPFSPGSRVEPSRDSASPTLGTQAGHTPNLSSLSGARAPGSRAYTFPSAPRHLCPRPDGSDRPPPRHRDRTPPAIGPGRYIDSRRGWDTGGGKWGRGPAAGMVPVPAGPAGHGALGPGTYRVAKALAFGTSPAGAVAPAFSFGFSGAQPLPRRPSTCRSGACMAAGRGAVGAAA